MSGILVGSKCRASSTLYSRPTPNRLIATTNSPLTAPPRNAICRALFRLERAALAVRMFERTATYMPTKPATPERFGALLDRIGDLPHVGGAIVLAQHVAA